MKTNKLTKRKGIIKIHPYTGQVLSIKKGEAIEVEMEDMLKERFGCKCPEFHWGCIQCKVWDVYERFKIDLTKEYMK